MQHTIGLPTLFLSVVGFTALRASAEGPLDCGRPILLAGEVTQGTPVQMEVSCRNVTVTPLRPGIPGTGCPCLTATVSESSVPPGQTLSLRLRLDTRDLRGVVEFPVEIPLSGGPAPLSAIVRLRAVIRPSVVSFPEFVDFGDFRRQPSREVVVIDTTGHAFTIQEASSSRGRVRVQWQSAQFVRIGDAWVPSEIRGAVRGYRVVLEADAVPQSGRASLSDEVILQLRHPIQPQLRLRILGYSP